LTLTLTDNDGLTWGWFSNGWSGDDGWRRSRDCSRRWHSSAGDYDDLGRRWSRLDARRRTTTWRRPT